MVCLSLLDAAERYAISLCVGSACTQSRVSSEMLGTWRVYERNTGRSDDLARACAPVQQVGSRSMTFHVFCVLLVSVRDGSI